MKIVPLHSDKGRSYKTLAICLARAVLRATLTPTQSPYQPHCTVQSCSEMAEDLKVSVPYNFRSCRVMLTNNCPSGLNSGFVPFLYCL